MVVAENLPLFSKERDRERERESGGWNKNKHKTSAIVGTDLFVPVLLHVCPEWHDINTKHQPKRTTHADNNGERVSEMAFFCPGKKGINLERPQKRLQQNLFVIHRKRIWYFWGNL
jgi:hypothetical protein